MSDVPDPHHVQVAAEASTGAWSVLTTGLAGVMATVAGFVFKDFNQRLKSGEKCHIEIVEKLAGMATKQDIKDIHKKIDNLSRENTDRIISIIESQKGD